MANSSSNNNNHSGAAAYANLSDLKDVLKETLDARGSLNQIKARIRAEIFAALDDQDVPKPKLSNDNLIINELIREYLEYNGYRHALSVFLPESGQPVDKPFPREFLAQELSIEEDPRFMHVPLLYSVVASLQQQASEQRRGPTRGSDDQTLENPARDRTVEEPCTVQSRQLNAGEPSPLMFRK